MSSNPISTEALYAQLGRLIEDSPDLTQDKVSSDTLTWVARAIALLERSGDRMGMLELKVAANSLGSSVFRWNAARDIELTLRTALARAELAVPVSSQGSFIPAGNTFDAFAAVGKVFATSKSDVFILDPYASEKIFEFVTLVPEGVTVRILSDPATFKNSLKPAAERWAKQFATNRPLEVRLCAPRTLHDRLILVDKTNAWTVGQSFKDLAERAHTSLVRVDPETAALKIAAHETMWTSSTVL